ncbi:MAG: hypothetical protein VYD19_07440, partial [Myxococcota bacterium]|nr:hypothetical protein [Myxococcota bacterium]
MRLLFRLLIIFFLCGAPPLSAEETIYDAVERIFGASNVNAITGHGRLSVGLSRDGDLTVLTWPSP